MSEFTIEVCSDVDYEELVVDISNKDGRIATLDCDSGIENTIISIIDMRNDKVLYKFNFFSFLEVLDNAFERLKEVNPE